MSDADAHAQQPDTATAKMKGQKKKKKASYRKMLMQAGVGRAATSPAPPDFSSPHPEALKRHGLGGGAFEKVKKI